MELEVVVTDNPNIKVYEVYAGPQHDRTSEEALVMESINSQLGQHVAWTEARNKVARFIVQLPEGQSWDSLHRVMVKTLEAFFSEKLGDVVYLGFIKRP